MAMKMAHEESEAADLNMTLAPGVKVCVLVDDYRDQWFHKWPGVITRLMERERKVFVEFMGFGPREHRTKVFDPREVALIPDAETAARVDMVLRQLKIQPNEGRGHWRRRPEVEEEAHKPLHVGRTPPDVEEDGDSILGEEPSGDGES